jgi:hypothetical protein
VGETMQATATGQATEGRDLMIFSPAIPATMFATTIRDGAAARTFVDAAFTILGPWRDDIVFSRGAWRDLSAAVSDWADAAALSRAVGAIDTLRLALDAFVLAGGIRRESGQVGALRGFGRFLLATVSLAAVYRAAQRRLGELGGAAGQEPAGAAPQTEAGTATAEIPVSSAA